MTDKTLERSVEAELVARVQALGGICDKIRFIGKRGCFDRLVALPGGRVILVEVKRPKGGRIRPQQTVTHTAYKKLGVAVAVVRNLDDIRALLNVS